MADWRKAREEMERDIKKTLVRQGCDERQAADFASKRANEGMRRAVHIANDEGTTRPEEI